MKKVQQGKKKLSWTIMPKHEKSATWEKCNTKKT